MKLWKILIVCLFSSFLLTGCWDRKDPEDRENPTTASTPKAVW